MPHRPARTAANLALALALLYPGPSAAQEKEAYAPCAQPLQASLQQLVDLPESLWRFVILRVPKGSDFIQFAWWGGVVVDLPVVALDAAQQARATRVFDQLGAGTPVLIRGPDGSTTDSSRAFQHDFGRDTAAAARFGCAALRSIYVVAGDRPLEVVVGGD